MGEVGGLIARAASAMDWFKPRSLSLFSVFY